MKLTLGTDPEFAICEGNKQISAIGLLHGKDSLAAKKKLKINEGVGWYYDNMLAECTVKPATTETQWIKNIKNSLGLFHEQVDRKYRLKPQAAVDFDKDQFDHPDCFKIACDAEYCAYTLETIDKSHKEYKSIQKKFKKTKFRGAGGHIHFGHPDLTDGLSQIAMTRMLDLFVGIPSIYLNKDPSELVRKLDFYGKAGRYRKPDYGVEYRTLGNFWLETPAKARMMWKMCQATFKLYQKGTYDELWSFDEEKAADDDFWAKGGDPTDLHTCHIYNPDELRDAILTGDPQKAAEFYRLAMSFLPDDLCNEISEVSEFPPCDFYHAWKL